jgi:hypothetical protein
LEKPVAAAEERLVRLQRTYMSYQPAVEPSDFATCPIMLVEPGEDRWSPMYLSGPGRQQCSIWLPG